MPTLYDIHMKVVKKLIERGETIYNPTITTMQRVAAPPDVYVKGRPFPSPDFVSGNAVEEKDGTITIIHDHLAYYKPGFKLENLGLCDPTLWYENSNLLAEREKREKERIEEEKKPLKKFERKMKIEMQIWGDMHLSNAPQTMQDKQSGRIQMLKEVIEIMQEADFHG